MEVNQRKAGVILSYILTGTNAVIGFIYIPLLVKYLGRGEYGLYQLIGSFIVYLNLFDTSLSNTVVRYYSKYLALKDKKAEENLLFLSSIIYVFITIIIAIAGTILFFFLNNIFENSLSHSEIVSAKKMYIILLITTVITISTSVFNSIVIAHERFIFVKSLSIFQAILTPIMVISIFYFEASAVILVFIQAIINILGVFLTIYYSIFRIKVKIKFHNWDTPLLKEMFYYLFFILVSVLMDQIFWRSDQIVLGIVKGTVSVAVFSIASQIINYYMTLSTSMSGVFLPSITKKVMDKASSDELSDLFIKVGRLQYILLGVILSGFILFGKDFITIWVGSNFIQAYYITIIIMIPFTIDLIQNIGLTILQAKNMYSFRALLYFGMSVTKVVASIPLAIHYGGLGAAIATGISYLVGNGIIMNIYYLKKLKLNILSFWKEIGRLSVPIFIAFLIGLPISNVNIVNPIISLVIKIGAYVTVYGGVTWLLGMNKYEKSLLLNTLQR
ncbi:oligosaccharide flippase family protein [Heyndrickxia coagulans]|uniref:Uncharacterized protein n=1 Tax=Heyndrickxia coagulans TaxID=1398 RepID=A0A150KDW1_HEYCO|nr:oligosaccharide flippase family protein [Heyndrickxia coagulans]KYC67054.1 hypothetical protein B4099_1048 [Heyndrickxia coagulans]